MSLPTKHRPGDMLLREGKGWVSRGINLAQHFILQPGYEGETRNWWRRGYPKPDYRNTHVGYVMGDGRVFEATAPVARISTVEKFVEPSKFWRVMRRQRGHGQPLEYSDEAIEAMDDVARSVVGTPYDVGELLGFLARSFGWNVLPRGFKADWFVCSTATAYVEEMGRRTMSDGPERSSAFGRMAQREHIIEAWPRAWGIGGGRYKKLEDITPADYGYHYSYMQLEAGRAGE